jgi:valyl-tRNA synthetase
MLGDTGVAVNPNDERYKHLIGKKVLLPIVNREIPIFADDYVELEFGTGVVKVTPAHDVNDYEMGKRNYLEFINIFNDDASTNDNVPGEFRKLDRYIVRKKVVAKFEELGLLEKIEDYTNNVGYSERGNVPIEPYLSEQWFMKMDELVKPAMQVVKEGKINFHPAHWHKTYEHWMSKIRDWCISRQLWWGHRIPVWYCDGSDAECKAPIVAVDTPEMCPHCGSTNLRQDNDVLDTWASSWLWAQDVFTNEKDQKYYYPTDLLVTAPDIIFFWVARMIIAGMKFMGDIPFNDVYFTSIIRDVQGRKMSKSLGNSPDPLEVIKDYGADALRFTINYIAPLGQDVLFSTDKCELGRNFANKIWNAARFLMMNAQDVELDPSLKDKHIDFTDKWIMTRFQKSLKQMSESLDKFDINGASKTIYSFIWNDFCDWYLELSKKRMYSNDSEVKSAVLIRSLSIFEDMLKMLHPFMPFISEEIWQLLDDRKEGESISTSKFPEYNASLIDESAENDIVFVQNVVTGIRNIRGEMNIAPSKQIDVYLKSESLMDIQKEYIKSLTRAGSITVDANLTKPKASASVVVKGCDIFIPLEGLIDLDVEKNRLEKESLRLRGLLAAVNKKLANEKFVNNAPADVVEKEKAKQRDWENSINKINSLLADLN